MTRIYPTQEQKLILKKWINASRWYYNQAVAYLNQPGTVANFFAIKTGLLSEGKEWWFDVPYQIKSIAIRDACDAVKAAKRKFKALGSFNKVSFRSKKNSKQSIFVPSSAISNKGVYSTKLGKLRMTEALSAEVCDSRLVYQFNRWFLCVPYKKAMIRTENQGRVVALDPGVRTFMTAFSEEEVVKYGEHGFKRIYRLCKAADKIKSLQTKTPKTSLSRAFKNICFKIKCLKDELHWQTINRLIKAYDVILLPTFDVSQMVIKNKRKLRRKSVRSMLTLNHYQFSQRLKAKALELGKTVVDVCEAYTSKTCSWNGQLVNVGGSKIIKADDVVLDRDINGARGILLRALVDSPWFLNLNSKEFLSKC